MAINRWREVRGTDEGCMIFQCLSCYGQWEGRGYLRGWSYCPLCGTKWDGKQECRNHGEPKHRWQDETRLSYEEERAQYQSQRLWSLDQREVVDHYRDGSRTERPWRSFWKTNVGSVSTQSVLVRLQKVRQEEADKQERDRLEEEEERKECEAEGEKYIDLGCRTIKEFRVRLVARREI